MLSTLKAKSNSSISQLFFLLLILGIGGLIVFKLSYLAGCILGSIALYTVLRRPLFYLTERKHWRAWLASLAIVLLTVLLLLAFGFLIFNMIFAQIPQINTDAIINAVVQFVDEMNVKLGFTLISVQTIMESKGLLMKVASVLFNSTYNMIINFFLMMLLLYFMLAKARLFETTIFKYSPFEGESLDLLKKEVKSIVYTNVIGIPIIMIAQGLVAALGYWIIGVDKPLFWAFFTAIFGLVPLVGTALIWVSLAIFYMVSGDLTQGIILLLYGAIIISNADNVCRMILMKTTADVHPLIIVFGIILGIPLFGFWGIIFGPLLISGFLLLLKIYYMAYRAK
jgi:predicted PurR-regulated permease PerM